MGNYEKANTESQQNFIEEVSNLYNEQHILIFMDRASWRTTKKLVVPDNIKLVFLPRQVPN